MKIMSEKTWFLVVNLLVVYRELILNKCFIFLSILVKKEKYIVKKEII